MSIEFDRGHVVGASKAIRKTIDGLVERGLVHAGAVPDAFPSDAREAVYDLLVEFILNVDDKATRHGVNRGILLAASMFESGEIYLHARSKKAKVRRGCERQQISYRITRKGLRLQEHRDRPNFSVNVKRIIELLNQ